MQRHIQSNLTPFNCKLLLAAGFRDFVLRGNVVDLAVAVVVGSAFSSLVAAFVADWLTLLVAVIFGDADGTFGSLSFTLRGSVFNYGYGVYRGCTPAGPAWELVSSLGWKTLAGAIACTPAQCKAEPPLNRSLAGTL